MSNILVCCLCNGVVFILHMLFAALQHHRCVALVGCAWHIPVFHKCPPPPTNFCNLILSTKHKVVYTWDATISLTILPSLYAKRCSRHYAWHVSGWCIGFGWKVHGMVHCKVYGFLYTPVSTKKDLSKRKAFLVPGCRMWILEYLATQKVTHIVLPT